VSKLILPNEVKAKIFCVFPAGVDYKGVREIMKACMDKLVLMPDFSTINNLGMGESFEEQLLALHSVTALMLDREAPLLPGYFVINEILKAYPDNPLWPHWTLAPLVSSFMNSFRPAAQIVTSVYKPKMKPGKYLFRLGL
jgi:mediator of RNA polymerase II transcription subunit 23